MGEAFAAGTHTVLYIYILPIFGEVLHAYSSTKNIDYLIGDFFMLTYALQSNYDYYNTAVGSPRPVIHAHHDEHCLTPCL